MRDAHASDPPAGGSRPVLIYDGDCTFCAFWARYWQKLTGDRVEYRTYQDAAAHYPAISISDFKRAVQYVTPNGRVESAAKASFLTLSHARGKGIWLALYRRMPGFGTVTELAYGFIASHRSAFYRISLVLWGRNYGPPQYGVASGESLSGQAATVRPRGVLRLHLFGPHGEGERVLVLVEAAVARVVLPRCPIDEWVTVG